MKLRAEARDGEPPTHAEWIEDEGCRRTYYAVYIFFGMLTLTYNYTPNIGLNEFADQLASQVTSWTGNRAQIVAINRKELRRLQQAKEPIVADWQSELVVISGDVRILQSSSK